MKNPLKRKNFPFEKAKQIIEEVKLYNALATLAWVRKVNSRASCHLKVKFSKDLWMVKAGSKSVPPQPYFEFRTTFRHWLPQPIQNKVEEECF